MTDYEHDQSRQSDFDPFEKLRGSDFTNNSRPPDDSRPAHHHPQQHQSQDQQKGMGHPFNREFINSIFSLNRDLLICKLFYFFFFAAFGSLFPLLAIYFKQLGMNASQSGILIGFRPFIEFLSAPFWAGLADKWRRGKDMLLFSLLCWIAFTIAIAFVHPPAHKCLTFNGTHHTLESPLGRSRRDATFGSKSIIKGIISDENDFKENSNQFDSSHHHKFAKSLPPFPTETRHPPMILSPGGISPVYNEPRHRSRRSPYTIDPSKIVNANASDLKGLVFNRHSTIVYQENEVQHAFFILLLLVVLGEFFSAPAITFADSVTLSFLGNDVQNYGRQRMFGSLGWGLAMFIVGMALNASDSFPDHPCGEPHQHERNYTVCFGSFTVLMSSAFLIAIQFRFDHHSKEIRWSDAPAKIKKTVKDFIQGYRKVDRERLVEEDEDGLRGGDNNAQSYQNMDDTSAGKNGSGLKINPGPGSDMVTDALRAPGAKAGRGMGPTGALPFGSAAANYSDQPFFGKWVAVAKLLASYQYISVLFVAWFMGFGIGIIFTFLFWHLQDLGGSPMLFALATVINHISELLAYFLTGNFIVKYGHVKLLYAGLVGNIFRFMYISFLRNPWWVLPFEFVQGLTHAAVWAACCAYITHAIPVELRSSAQGILQGLHHGLGRGCGAVFGGLMVFKYGGVVTFRIYGVTCIIILITYMGVNYFLERKGLFSHGTQVPQEMFEDTSQLAPQGVPSGMARDLSNSRLAANEHEQGYGATSYEGTTHLPVQGTKDRGRGGYSGQDEDNPMHHGYHQGDADKITMFETPRLPTNIYKQQPRNTYQQDYGP